MRYPRKCSSFWANAFIHSALTSLNTWVRHWQSPRPGPASQDLHADSCSLLYGKQQVQSSDSKYCRALEMGESRTYRPSVEACLGEVGTGQLAPNTPHVSPNSRCHHGLLRNGLLILEYFWGTSLLLFLLSFQHILR